MRRSKKADPDFDGTWFRKGVAQFNRGEYWNAHESWETIWLESDGEKKQFLQGLIQLAAMCFHVEKGNLRGASRLREAALRRLDELPAEYGGLPLDELRSRSRTVSLDDPAEVRRLRIRFLAH